LILRIEFIFLCSLPMIFPGVAPFRGIGDRSAWPRCFANSHAAGD
jgi:hypothetical protein